jgi:hypothetical protein
MKKPNLSIKEDGQPGTLAEYLKTVDSIQEYGKTLKQVDCPVVSEFAPGVYARTILMKVPEGEKELSVIGKTHKTEHWNVVHTGRCLLMMDGVIKEIVAPDMFISKAGVKKLLIILEDMTWTTFHATEEKDIDKIEAETVLTEEEEKDLISYLETLENPEIKEPELLN